jgi:hypothetical protein
MRLIRRSYRHDEQAPLESGRVEFVSRPEPDPEAREAIALVLEHLLEAGELPPSYGSRWRAEGIAENLDGEDEAPAGRRSAQS